MTEITVRSRKQADRDFILVFETTRVLDRESHTFEPNLIEDLSLLQENTGGTGAQKSGASFEDYVHSLNVAWELLPPGTKDEAVARVFRGRIPTPAEKQLVKERYDFLMRLKPKRLVFGLSGIQRYFGAMLKENLVVFENIEYGNALYVMFDDWKVLSQKSRTDLISGRFGKNFERVVHGAGWKNKVKEIVKEH